MDKCRACFANEKNLIPMDASFLQGFNLLTGLCIEMSGMSLYTCKSCCDAVKFFMDFRNRCIEADQFFHNILVTVSVEEIKHENEISDQIDPVLPHVGEEMKSESYEILCDDVDNQDSELSDKTEFDGLTSNKTVSKERKVIHDFIKKRRIKEKYTDKVHCGLCDSKLKDRSELSRHLEYHKSLFNAQISCGLCTERFINLPHMLGHRLEHIPPEQRLCHICSKKFVASSATCLEFHYMRAHGMADKDAEIQCKQCPSRYVTSRKLIRHVRNCHSAPRYKCPLCNQSFRNKTLLNVHTKMKHTDGKRVKCDLCDFTSKYANSLMLHKRRKHTSDTFRCSCHRVFVDEGSLARHAAVCQHGARVICAVCGHSVRKVWLKHHMRSHSDTYPFKCDRCPAQYKYRTGLKEHSDKHEGTLDFHCDLCTKRFCIKSALHSHRRTHSDEKPFVCDICKAGFKRRYNLKAHMNAHPWSAAEHTTEKKI